MELVFKPITFCRRRISLFSLSTTTSIRPKLAFRGARLCSVVRGRSGFRKRQPMKQRRVRTLNRADDRRFRPRTQMDGGEWHCRRPTVKRNTSNQRNEMKEGRYEPRQETRGTGSKTQHCFLSVG